MAVICGNTGVPVGSKICKLCVSHGCEGYKQATKQDKQWNYNLEKEPLFTTLKLLSGYLVVVLVVIVILFLMTIIFKMRIYDL